MVPRLTVMIIRLARKLLRIVSMIFASAMLRIFVICLFLSVIRIGRGIFMEWYRGFPQVNLLFLILLHIVIGVHSSLERYVIQEGIFVGHVGRMVILIVRS